MATRIEARTFWPVLATALLLTYLATVAVGQSPAVSIISPGIDRNITGRDDIAQLKELIAGVGWDFEHNARTEEGLKRIGVRRMRVGNVSGGLPGSFNDKGEFVIDQSKPSLRLKWTLDTCRKLGASPHVILAEVLPAVLVKKTADGKPPAWISHPAYHGPNDWGKYRSYYKAFMKHILIDQGFPNATFEVGNEADNATVICADPPAPVQGARRTYELYFEQYAHTAAAAEELDRELQKTHPGVRVRIGGPALTWAFTFRFGDFNWTERFLRDVHREKLKLDFVTEHFYGNVSPLAEELPTNLYPSFSEMLRMTRQWRDRYVPGTPIWFTEWGPTYHTSNAPYGRLVGGSHVGAAWTAAFVNQLLIDGVDKAFLLAACDARHPVDGKMTDVWGWSAAFSNTVVSGGWPKPLFHTLDMISRLAPTRVEASNPGGTFGCIASRNDDGRLTVLVWNHSYHIAEFGMGQALPSSEMIQLKIRGAEDFFKGPVEMKRWLVSRTISNAYHIYIEKKEPLDERVELQCVDEATLKPVEGQLSIGLYQPASSVSLIELVRK